MRPVLKVERFGEASIDSDESVSKASDALEAENVLLPSAEYDRLVPARVPSDKLWRSANEE